MENRRSRSYIPGHLNSPITRDEIDFMTTFDKFYCKRHKEIKKIMREEDYEHHIYHPSCKCHYTDCLINNLIENVEKMREFKTINIKKRYQSTIEVASDSLKVHLINMFECLSSFNLDNVNTLISKIRDISDDYLLEQFKHKIIAEIVKDKICYTPIEFGEFIKFHNIKLDSDIFFFNCSKHGKTFGPTSLLLSVLDELHSRFDLLLYWKLSDIQNKYKTSMYNCGKRLINVFTNLRTEIGEKVYNVLNQWEPLLIGWIIKDPDKDLGYEELYENAKEEIKAEAPKFDISKILPEKYDDDRIRMYLELTGIIKSFGHPCLDLKPGLEKIRKHACEEVESPLEDINCVVWTFRKHFCLNYFQKHRRWPNVKLDKLDPSLKKDFQNNTRPLKLQQLPITVWETVEFEKVFDFDITADTSELIKDSSISLPRENWADNFDNCAFQNHYDKPKPHTDSTEQPRRAVMRFFVGDTADLEKKVKELDKGFFGRSDNIAIFCRKEREINVFGRFFVKQTYLQRLAQVIGEKNLAKKIMEYIIEQTMTNSELQLISKHCQTIKSMVEGVEIICMDFEKWCLKFRHPILWKFGRDLDRLFGLERFYTDSHLWFVNCLVLLNSRLAPPDYDHTGEPIPGDFCHKDHRGGMEGMHQKKWTIFQIYAIHYCAEQLKIRVSIAAQGDNQVILLKYSKDQLANKGQIRRKFLDLLNNFTKKLNLKLKSKETWYSKQLFEYGKQRYFKFETVSQATKKMVRLIPDINDGICSDTSSFSSINTITEAAARYDHLPHSSFFVNQYEILHFMLRKRMIVNPRESFDLLYFPSCFGGLSLSTLYSHTVRGHDDKLTLWLSLLFTFLRVHPEHTENCFKNITLIPLRTRNFSRLIEDIFCLNLKSLPSLEATFKERALNYLMSENVINPEITQLFNNPLSFDGESLIAIISTMDPFYPALAHELLRNSNYGILLSKRNKFSNIQTINKTLQVQEDLDYLDEMAANNQAVIQCIKNNRNKKMCIQSLNIIKTMICPTQVAHALRELHWGINLVGDTKPYVIHQITIIPYDKCPKQYLRRGIQVQLSKEFINSSIGFLESVGPFPPYIGSTTQEKIKKPNMDTFQPDDYSKSIQQLHIMLTWIEKIGNPEFTQFIRGLINEKMRILPKELQEIELRDWCVSTFGGNVIHRFQSVIEKRSGMINFMPLISTHFKFCTDEMYDLMKKGKDYTIFFQLIFVSIIGIMTSLRYFSPVEQSYIAVVGCNHCTKEVTDISFKLKYTSPSSAPVVGSTALQLSLSKMPASPEVVKWLSVFAGHAIGLSSDALFYALYQKTTAPWEEVSHQYRSCIGVTEFRGCNFDYIITGILQTSRIVRSHISTKKTIIDIKDKTLVNLGHMLIITDRLQEFMKYSGQNIYNHSQGTDAKSLAPFLTDCIVSIVRKKPLYFISLYLTFNYETEEIHRIYHRVMWVINEFRLRDILGGSFMRLMSKKAFKSLHTIIPRVLRALRIQNTKYSYNITEDEIILYWRSYLVRGINMSHKCADAVKRPANPHLNQLNYSLRQVVSLHRKLSTFVEGIEMNVKNIHHLARPLGSISSAVNKLYEFILGFKLEHEIVGTVCNLAEGSGSIALGFRKLYSCEILFNTLMDPEIDPRVGISHNLPPAFLNGTRADVESLKSLDTTCAGTTDILNEDFILKMKGIYKIYPPTFITIDAESKTATSNLIFLSTYKPVFDSIKSVKYLLVKIFFVDQIVTAIESIVKENFIIFKPISSNINNSECYLFHWKGRLSPNTQEMVDYYKEHELSILENIGKMNTKSTTLKEYIMECLMVNSQLRSFNDKMGLDLLYCDKLTPHIESGSICGLTCTRYLNLLFDDLAECYKDHLENITINAIVYRNEGKQNNIKNKSIMFTALIYVLYTPGDLARKIEYLATKYIMYDFIENEEVELGDNILSELDDGKIFFKRITESNCTCGHRISGKMKLEYYKKLIAFFECNFGIFIRNILNISTYD